MNFNKSDLDKLQMNDSNIKSHLNNSLDTKGIHVSDDLVQRTLQAIRNDEMNQEESDALKAEAGNEKKKIDWKRSTRRFAGVVAAGIVLIAGIGVIDSMGWFSNDLKDAAPNEVRFSSQESSMDQVSDDLHQDTSLENGQDESGLAANDFVSPNMQKALTSSVATSMSFQEVSMISSDQVKSIALTKQESNDLVTWTDEDQILAFYQQMESFDYETDTLQTVDVSYSIEIQGTSGATSVILVGEGITARYSFKEEEIINNYTLADMNALLQQLEENFS